jgi:hypothetical protein
MINNIMNDLPKGIGFSTEDVQLISDEIFVLHNDYTSRNGKKFDEGQKVFRARGDFLHYILRLEQIGSDNYAILPEIYGENDIRTFRLMKTGENLNQEFKKIDAKEFERIELAERFKKAVEASELISESKKYESSKPRPV